MQVQCLDCGYTYETEKGKVARGKANCSKCSLRKNYKGNIINNITVIDKGYTGRNGQRYYECKCNNCGEQMYLTRAEILAYKCNKE